MQVIKRNGKREVVSFDKILARIKKLCYELNPEFVDSTLVSMKVIQGIYDGVTTTELDNLAAETAATMATIHPDYAKLAFASIVSRIKFSSGSQSASPFCVTVMTFSKKCT